MTLDGYKPVDVTPWETASGGKAVVCVDRAQCSASLTWKGPDGWYDIAVQYFDAKGGDSQFALEAAGRTVLAWTADMDRYPGMNGNTSTRLTLDNVALHRGDVVRLIGKPNGDEPAPFDYIRIAPLGAGGAAGDSGKGAVQ